ncbi:hypothetical protein NPIL_154741 [Nephila pilipes]|uniref:Uncharacterized protein n=1 Tax=Nephila pilipes TaxID=299642 RepID=A0A8X6Q2Z8_NEPPI|nr:hypothetical protein NPIL_154741 [Nephila pilipes]
MGVPFRSFDHIDLRCTVCRTVVASHYNIECNDKEYLVQDALNVEFATFHQEDVNICMSLSCLRLVGYAMDMKVLSDFSCRIIGDQC